MYQPLELTPSQKKLFCYELLFPLALLTLGIYHGFIQTLYRAGWVQSQSFLGIEYYQGLTLHGVINAIVFTTMFAVAFGNAIVLYYLRKGLHMPTAWTSAWMMIIGTLMAAYAMLAGKASVLYTFYPPLKADPAFYIGAVLLVVGSWVGFFNWIPPYLRWRKDNPGKKMPMAILGIFTAFIVWFLATIPLAVQVLFLILPWVFGWVDGIHVTLARTLFWFFGHALVYFWLLPVYTMYYAMFPKIAGGKLYSDMAGRIAFFLFIVFSVPIGMHHQFSDPGLSAGWKWFQGLTTFVVALPSFITAFTMAASLEYAAHLKGGKGLFAWWKKLPYWDQERWMFPYLFVGLVLFIFGGITGIINASISMNSVIHNTSWVPGHFHTTLGGPVFLGFIAMSLWILMKALGKPLVMPKAVLAVPYLWLLGIVFFSGSMSLLGLTGEPRRTNLGLTFTNPDSPLFNPLWKTLSSITVVGGTIMFIAMIVYFVVLARMLIAKRQTQKSEIDFPTAEPLHDEKVGALLLNFKPWLIFAALLILIAYVPQLLDIDRGTKTKAPRFLPGLATPLEHGR
jgi:cytochrome c oxidase subunit 1